MHWLWKTIMEHLKWRPPWLTDMVGSPFWCATTICWISKAAGRSVSRLSIDDIGIHHAQHEIEQHGPRLLYSFVFFFRRWKIYNWTFMYNLYSSVVGGIQNISINTKTTHPLFTISFHTQYQIHGFNINLNFNIRFSMRSML